MDITATTFEDIRKLDADTAREVFEAIRWEHGAECPHCECKEVYKLTPKSTSKRSARKGVYKCKKCRKQFTVTVGTVFEGSHIGLDKWLMTVYLICSSKKGISAHQLHRTLGITYKSAWFMAHRIRYAMSQRPLADMLKGTVEVDETYVGGKSKGKRGRGTKKTPVLSLVERGGRKRSFTITNVTSKTLKKVISKEVDINSHIMTDEFRSYRGLNQSFASHSTVNHGRKEYARGNTHVNSAESSFALLKRGIHGTFHSVSKQHLERYLDEFDYRWDTRESTDIDRTVNALVKTKGKRLKYKADLTKKENLE